MFRKIYILINTAILAVFCAGTSVAESFDYRFDVRLGVVKIGEMQIAASNNGTSYSAGAVLFTTGLVGALYDVRFDYRVEGRVDKNGTLLPVRHSAFNDEQGNVSRLEVLYIGDRVVSVTFDPMRNVSEEVLDYRRTLDTMSLIYFLMRPVKATEACKGEVVLFGGQNRGQVGFTDIKRFADGHIECDVFYSSDSGKDGLAPSALIFDVDNNGLVRIREFEVDTNIGTLTVQRR